MAKYQLRDVKFSRVSLVDKGASFDKATGDGAHVVLFKRHTNEEKQMDKAKFDELLKALAGITDEQKESLKKALGAPAAAEVELTKLSPAVRELIEKANADAAAAKAEAATSKAAIEKITKAARRVELQKRVDVHKKLGGGEVIADVLGLIEDADKDLSKKFEEKLSAWNAQLVKSELFSKAGSRGTSEQPMAVGGDEISDEIERLVSEVVQKDAKATREQAMAKVFEANPDLYERYANAIARPGGKAAN